MFYKLLLIMVFSLILVSGVKAREIDEFEDDAPIRVLARPTLMVSPTPKEETRKQFETAEKVIIDPRVIDVTQEQNFAQQKISILLAKIDSQNKWKRIVFGSDLELLNALKKEISDNQKRIDKLKQIGGQEQMVKVLEKEKQDLNDKIKVEEMRFSLLGWLFRWLQK
jgi:hypothetical protein